MRKASARIQSFSVTEIFVFVPFGIGILVTIQSVSPSKRSRPLMRFTLIVISLTSLLAAQPVNFATGTWSWSGLNEAGGFLRVAQKNGTARFQLECYRGGPSFNSGFVGGEMKFNGRIGTFQSTEFGRCRIVFEFHEKEVVIREDTDTCDCGFGYGVTANGIYRLKTHRMPKFHKGDPRNAETKLE